MSAGSRRTYLVIEESSTAVDSFGADVETWTEFRKVWAQVRPNQGKESFSGSQIKSEITHIIKTRYISGVNTRMRLMLNGRVLSIEGITNLYEKNRELEILAKEYV